MSLPLVPKLPAIPNPTRWRFFRQVYGFLATKSLQSTIQSAAINCGSLLQFWLRPELVNVSVTAPGGTENSWMAMSTCSYSSQFQEN